MLSIVKGLINHPYITNNIIPNIEHGPTGKIHAIVLHRTSATTAKSTLNSWKTRKYGAHFLVGKDGKIYQTAHLNQQCFHMGQVKSKCRIEQSCTKNDLKIIKDYLFNKKKYGNLRHRWNKITGHEKAKSYPDRYPMNFDSIGIEIVGAYLGGPSSDAGPFERLTCMQSTSVLWLMDILLDIYKLNFLDDVYAHGNVSHKKLKEGAGVKQWLQDFYS